jgi:hypothetical protein
MFTRNWTVDNFSKGQRRARHFDHLPVFQESLPTNGLLNKSVQLAQDHAGHGDVDSHHDNIVQNAHRFLTRFGDETSPHVLTIQKLGRCATGQREHFGAMFPFENHSVRKHAYCGTRSTFPRRVSYLRGFLTLCARVDYTY